MTALGSFLQDRLTQLGLTQAQLAAHVGVDVKVVNRLCRGRTRLSNDAAMRISRALGLSYQQLVCIQAMDDEAELSSMHAGISMIGGSSEPS